QGRLEAALRAFTAAEGMQARIPRQHPFTLDLRSRTLRTRVQLGQTAAVRAALENMDEPTRRRAGMRITAAAIDLAEGRPHDAVDELGPVIERSAQALYPRWATIEALLFDAAARERMGDRHAAETSLERALGVAEPEGIILPFTAAPVRGLLQRHPGHRTAHATLLSEIRDVLAGGPRRRTGGTLSGHELSDAELRVIRYLPSNLKAPEIAAELFVSPNTVRTHLRHIYAKLDAHSRAEAVDCARELGLLAPSVRLR
ncbi:MAG TPA: LuxR C-terminal-related transcriptional regulator, partial [Solirubrobacteraceae bacterium]|nr:LuxR C-terminal-related transcriptional regulator [Solirubrobacteraceae bacterium]